MDSNEEIVITEKELLDTALLTISKGLKQELHEELKSICEEVLKLPDNYFVEEIIEDIESGNSGELEAIIEWYCIPKR